MDWLDLRAKFSPRPATCRPRSHEIQCLQRVLDGTQYDDIPNAFNTERGQNGEYVPLDQRRPAPEIRGMRHRG